jgi:hypothetical protein
MLTRRPTLSALLVAALASAVAPTGAATGPPLDPLVRDVLSVYFRVGPDEGALRDKYVHINYDTAYGWDGEVNHQRLRDANVAEERFAALSIHELRECLVPLFSGSAPGNATYVSAAYILARKGVDVYDNVRRMGSPLRLRQIDHSPLDRQVMGNVWPAVSDWLPARLADVYVAQKALGAVQALLPKTCRTENEQLFRAALLRILARDAKGTLRAASDTPGGLDRLTLLVRTPGVSPGAWAAARAALAKVMAPDVHAASASILNEMKSLERVRWCMLVTGNWDSTSWRKIATPYVRGEPDSSMGQGVWQIYTEAVAARKAINSMSRDRLRREFTPLFPRLTRSGVPYVCVAWVLAMHGVDTSMNVVRASSAMAWCSNPPYPELSYREQGAWPYRVYDDSAVCPEDWPGKLADLYRKTRDHWLLQTFLTAPVVLDGAMGEVFPEVFNHLARDFPVVMLRTASRSKRGTMRYVGMLSDVESGDDAMAVVRPLLKRFAAGKDKAMARTARQTLAAMDASARDWKQYQKQHPHG